MNRYTELTTLVRKEKPKHILEIGTWNGNRAIALCNINNSSYTGFDLFEEATKETDEIEKNVKKHNSRDSVLRKIRGNGIVCELIQGNTNITLPEYVKINSPKFDFAFIDGGHSVETIANDWKYVKELMLPNSLVVFDDYYENCSDLHIWGANKVLEGLDYSLGECRDPVVTGEFVRLATVRV